MDPIHWVSVARLTKETYQTYHKIKHTREREAKKLTHPDFRWAQIHPHVLRKCMHNKKDGMNNSYMSFKEIYESSSRYTLQKYTLLVYSSEDQKTKNGSFLRMFKHLRDW